jgi:hypothetical protein
MTEDGGKAKAPTVGANARPNDGLCAFARALAGVALDVRISSTTYRKRSLLKPQFPTFLTTRLPIVAFGFNGL